MLPRKSKINYRYLKSGIDFIGSMSWFQQIKLQTTLFCLTVALHWYFKAGITKAYEQTSEKEKSVINNHIFSIMLPGLL